MKCPRCGYVGFESGERCRHCGHEFALLGSQELPMRAEDPSDGPLADLDLSGIETAPVEEPRGGLDLDRLIGATPAPPQPPPAIDAPPDGVLPLFGAAPAEDDTPLIQAAGPPRPPLAVRRATAEVPRARTRTTRTFRPRDEPTLALEPEGEPSPDPGAVAERRVYTRPGAEGADPDGASGTARLSAAAIDAALLGGIDAVVVYLTLQIAGLTLDDAGVLPLAPLVAFLGLLNLGYLVAFTAAAGQTMGKMVTGVRVVPDGRAPMDVGRAVLRAAASLLSIGTLGAGFLPALLTPGGRTLHDRLAATRVVWE